MSWFHSDRLRSVASYTALGVLLVGCLPAGKASAQSNRGRAAQKKPANNTRRPPLAPRELHVLKGHQDKVWQVAFDPSGQTIASCSDDASIIFWDTRRRAQVDSLKMGDGGNASNHDIHGVQFGGVGNRLLAAASMTPWRTASGVLLVSDPRKGDVVRMPSKAEWSFRCCAIQTNGPLVAAGAANGAVRVFDTRKPVPRTDVQVQKGQPIPMTLEELTPAPALPGEINCLTFHSNPRPPLLAAGTSTGGIVLLEVTAKGVVRKEVNFPVQNRPIRGLAFDPKPPSRRLASACEDGAVTLWDLSTGGQLASYEVYGTGATGLAFDSAGKLLAVGYQDGSIRLWDTDSRKELFKLDGHEANRQVAGVAFSPNGRLLASCGGDFTVRIWELYPQPQNP
jgi:WD40 repeat protein